ncbi:MAG: aldehyde dehydrogenase family protein [Gammaproteobacteria bacterium]|nr:aldehyde dehydrogenase family protein [Gammaproteobacteria bacterium]
MQVLSPNDGSVIEDVTIADEQEVEAALALAYGTYRDKNAWLPVHERIAILERVVSEMIAQRSELAELAASEGGKPLVDSIVEVTRAIDSVKLCAQYLRQDAGSVVPLAGTAAGQHHLAFTQKEPIGVVVAVSAFNHPLNLIVHQVAPAIASGCPVIVKPAPVTPLSCLRFIEILHACGLPPQWAQALVIEDILLSEKLVTDKRLGFFSFIGSAKVGWMLRSKLAPGVRCALEHGGAAPVLVAHDAQLERAVNAIAKGGFYHAGQVCVSAQRLFVDKALADEFIEQLESVVRGLEVGSSVSLETEVGPLITPREVDRVEQWVDEAVKEGAQNVCGGQRIDDFFFSPTILRSPSLRSRVSREEIFGPVVAVYEFDRVSDALDQANSLPFSFQAAVFTQDLDFAMKCFRRLDASAVMVNQHSAFRVDGMPFAGLRESGLGVGGIPHTLQDMQVNKMMVIHSNELL